MPRTWSTTAVISSFIALFILLSASATCAVWFGYSLTLNENQVLYLFSTSSQVIAGVYGLTLTGFIFFRNELSREEFEDETLTDAVEELKKRYFALLAFITALVVVAIFFANLAISTETITWPLTKTLIINTGQSAFVTSLLAVTYFVFDVISPKRIESASLGLQEKLDPERSEQRKGSLEEFLRNYNQIEALLNEAGSPYQQFVAVSSYEPRHQRRMSNARLAEILVKSDRIDKVLFHKLRELITLRNSIIHGAEPVVSPELVQVSSQVLLELRASLSPAADEQ